MITTELKSKEGENVDKTFHMDTRLPTILETPVGKGRKSWSNFPASVGEQPIHQLRIKAA